MPHGRLISQNAGVAGVAPKRSIKIGFVCSLTSVAASTGTEMVNGFKLCLDQVNNQVAGRHVDVLVENDQSDPLTAVALVKKLVQDDNVDVVTGFAFSNVGSTIVPVCEKLQVPTLISYASANDLTQRPDFKWVFRTSRSAGQVAFPFGEYVYKKLDCRRVVVVAVDYAYGWNVMGSFQKAYEQAGGKIIQKIWIPLGFTDFRPSLRTIRKDSDAVFFITTGAASRIVLQQYHDLGFKTPILGDTSTFDEDIFRETRDIVPIGSISASTYSAALDTASNKAFVKAYRSRYGVAPTHFSEAGYTTGLWLRKGFEAVAGDTTNKEKLLNALKNVTLADAPRGPVKLDNYGNPIENVYIRKVEKVGNDLQNTVIFKIPKVSQFWKYNPSDIINQPRYSRDYPPCKFCTAQ